MSIQRMFAAAALAALLLAAPRTPAADNPDVLRLTQRLVALDADPSTGPMAAYERLQARQALDTLAATRSSQRASSLQIAEQRVEIAEIAARTAVIRGQIDTLERERSQWLVEASRQDAARARQEAERLRIQAQIQAEETARLREQADLDASARQDAETALDGVAGAQSAKLRAARQREAELARREAELMGGNPPAPTPTKPGTKKP